MAKIDLKRTSGLDLVYDKDELITKSIRYQSVIDVSIDEIREQLLNKELTCPEVFYKKFKKLDYNDIFSLKGIKVNLYVIKPNLAGIEFVKTRATKCTKYPRIIEVIHGGGVILLQKYKTPKDNRIIKIIVKKEQKIIVPPGYSMVAVNSRQNLSLIYLEYMSKASNPKLVLDARNGMAYYIIRKNARQEIVRNPSYKIVNEPEKINWDKILLNYGITPKTPITKQLLRKYEKFDWLFKDMFTGF